MIHEIKFLSQQTKIASNHLFSKQLKTSNRHMRLEVSFLSSTATRQSKYYRLHLFIHYLPSQASGLSLAVSLRSWNWRILSEPTAPNA